MREFSDLAGRKWRVYMRLTDLNRVNEYIKPETGLDLLSAFVTLAEALTYPMFSDVLWALLEPQAKGNRIRRFEPSYFSDTMTGEDFEEAVKVVLQAIADYLQTPYNRQKLIELGNKLYDMHRRKIEQAIHTLVDWVFSRLLLPDNAAHLLYIAETYYNQENRNAQRAIQTILQTIRRFLELPDTLHSLGAVAESLYEEKPHLWEHYLTDLVDRFLEYLRQVGKGCDVSIAADNRNHA